MVKSTADRQSAAKSGKAAYVPSPGDIIKTDFSPQAGSEQAGYRPALVITPHSYNARVGMCIAFPITGQGKGYPFEVPLPEGLTTTGVVLADGIKALDVRVRGARFVEATPPEVLDEVRERLRPLLGF